MRLWLDNHRWLRTLLWATLAVAAGEGALVIYYLNNWFILPTL